jgi:hypothetical protein
MKTEYKEISVVSDTVTFPCLRKSKVSELVVLFFNKNSGIVVRKNDKFEKDYFYSGFMNADDNTVWAEVKGSVTFTSE